jgi:hypothetical protein
MEHGISHEKSHQGEKGPRKETATEHDQMRDSYDTE